MLIHSQKRSGSILYVALRTPIYSLRLFLFLLPSLLPPSNLNPRFFPHLFSPIFLISLPYRNSWMFWSFIRCLGVKEESSCIGIEDIRKVFSPHMRRKGSLLSTRQNCLRFSALDSSATRNWMKASGHLRCIQVAPRGNGDWVRNTLVPISLSFVAARTRRLYFLGWLPAKCSCMTLALNGCHRRHCRKKFLNLYVKRKDP